MAKPKYTDNEEASISNRTNNKSDDIDNNNNRNDNNKIETNNTIITSTTSKYPLWVALDGITDPHKYNNRFFCKDTLGYSVLMGSLFNNMYI